MKPALKMKILLLLQLAVIYERKVHWVYKLSGPQNLWRQFCKGGMGQFSVMEPQGQERPTQCLEQWRIQEWWFWQSRTFSVRSDREVVMEIMRSISPILRSTMKLSGTCFPLEDHLSLEKINRYPLIECLISRVFSLFFLICDNWLYATMFQGIVAAGLTQYRAYSTDEVIFCSLFLN